MGLEIERKFLVKGEYKSLAYKAAQITQGYLCSAPGRIVRVRVKDGKGFLTIKGPSQDGGISRYEWEKEIPVEEARELLTLCEPEIIDKTRYLIKSGEYTFEVDEFYGENEGLTMAEIELPYKDAPFERPAWLGEEVTGDRRYYNSSLRMYPYKRWKSKQEQP